MSETQGAVGVIHDLGYRRYDGPRLGRAQIIRALTWHSFRSAFGIGRGVKAKIIPILACIAICLPAFVNAFAVARGNPRLFGYDVYSPQLRVIVVTIFIAAQAPELVSRDLRSHVLPLYFSRPIRRGQRCCDAERSEPSQQRSECYEHDRPKHPLGEAASDEERRSALPSQADSRKNHCDQRGRGRELQENLDDVVQKLWDSHCSVFPFSSTKRFEVTPERRLAGSLNYFSPFQLPAKSVSKRVLPRITARPRFRW